MLPNSGITTTLVANTLGISNHSVSQLCTHSNINYYSKYKPISFQKSTGLTDQDRAGANWGYDFEPIVDCTKASSYNWKYKRPTGTSLSPFRLGDFRSYEHTADVFFRSGYTNGDEVKMEYNADYLQLGVNTYRLNPANGGCGMKDFSYNGTNIGNLYLGFLGKDKMGEWFFARGEYPGEGVMQIDGKELSDKYPINGCLVLATSDFTPPAYSTDTIPIKGMAFPIPHDEFFKDQTNSGNVLKLTVKPKTYFQFSLLGISSTLRGNYTTWYEYSTESNRFRSPYGNMYFKLQSTQSGTWSITIRDMSLTATQNFFDNSNYTITGASGLGIYDKNFQQITGNNSLILEKGDVYYVGGDLLMNKGYTDVPVYAYINPTFTFEYQGAEASYGPIYMLGTTYN